MTPSWPKARRCCSWGAGDERGMEANAGDGTVVATVKAERVIESATRGPFRNVKGTKGTRDAGWAKGRRRVIDCRIEFSSVIGKQRNG